MRDDRMTVREARAIVRALGLTIRNTGCGDFRVAAPGPAGEAGAYYTSSLADAVETARAMVEATSCTIEHGALCGRQDCECARVIGGAA